MDHPLINLNVLVVNLSRFLFCVDDDLFSINRKEKVVATISIDSRQRADLGVNHFDHPRRTNLAVGRRIELIKEDEVGCLFFGHDVFGRRLEKPKLLAFTQHQRLVKLVPAGHPKGCLF